MTELTADPLCRTCRTVRQIDDFLLTTDHWYVILADNQAYAGRCFVTLKRHAASLSELTMEEWQEFAALVRRIETAYEAAFGSGRPFNWTCMMNDAYKAADPQPHVHWHVRPRHAHPVTINETVLADTEYAHHYDRTRQQLLDEPTKRALADGLRRALQA